MTGLDDSWIKEERDHERRMAQQRDDERRRRRAQINERISTITIGAASVLIAAVVAALIWYLVSSQTTANTERDRICNEAGGTRTTIGGGAAVCVWVREIA
jgi:hypothetical protein